MKDIDIDIGLTASSALFTRDFTAADLAAADFAPENDAAASAYQGKDGVGVLDNIYVSACESYTCIPLSVYTHVYIFICMYVYTYIYSLPRQGWGW